MANRIIKPSLLVGVAFIGAGLPNQSAAQGSEEQFGLEEIIVTAQKREQSLQDVPIAVTAVTQESLAANRITTVNDLGSIAPGVTVRPSAGGNQVPSFTIRGQNSFGVVAGSDKQVSIYLDGVYISSPRGSIFDLPDIQRLEVLRGPQGTLFGRNATAGAINISTRDPDGTPHVRGDFSAGNDDYYRVRLGADLPAFGPFSAYVSFVRNYRRGNVRNAAGGTIWDRTLSPDPVYGKVSRSPNWLGTVESNSYFGALKFAPSDSFTTVYKYDRNEDDGSPDATAFLGYNPAFPGLGSSAALVGPILTALYNSQNIYQNNSREAPDVVTNGFVINRHNRVTGHSLTSTWQASDSISIKNVAAYRQSRVSGYSSIDGLSSLTFTEAALVPFATLSAFSSVPGFATLPAAQRSATIQAIANALRPTVGGRVILTASQATSESKQWSDELQANYTSQNLAVTVGGLWFHSKDVAGGPQGMQNTLSLTLPALPASGLVPLGNEGRYFNKATSIAAYAQIEYKLNDQLEIVAGGRITRDEKTSRFIWDTRLSNGTILPRDTIVPQPYKKTKPNYLIGVNWTPDENTLAYAKYSTSFVSGGSVAGIEFEPETASSFEVGLKADFFDRRLRTNLALFHVDYKHFQQPSSTNIAPEVQAFLAAQYGALATSLSSNLSTFVQQAHDVRAKGFELEVTAAPTHGLTAGGSLSYTDSQFRNINPVFLTAQGGEYKSFTRPKWTASAFVNYETEPLFDEARLRIRADALYRSKLLLSGNPSVQMSRGVPEEQLSSPGHWKFNGRVALTNLNLGGVSTTLAVWGRNLTDKQYASSTLFLPFGVAANYDPPRSFGADFTIEF